MNNDYFVNISDPVSLHSFLLFSAKSSIELSIKYQEINELKKEKQRILNELKGDISQIKTLLISFEELLPHKDLLLKEKPVIKKSVSSKKPAKPKIPSQEHSSRTSFTKLEKLQASLAEIERRLGDLS